MNELIEAIQITIRHEVKNSIQTELKDTIRQEVRDIIQTEQNYLHILNHENRISTLEEKTL